MMIGIYVEEGHRELGWADKYVYTDVRQQVIFGSENLPTREANESNYGRHKKEDRKKRQEARRRYFAMFHLCFHKEFVNLNLRFHNEFVLQQ